MRFLGIDYGSERIGLAISSENIAFPRAVYTNDKLVIERLKTLIEEEKIDRVIFGDARSFGGLENPITNEARMFAEMLQKETGLPLTFVDETSSSVEASRYQKKKRDESAAAIILQRYIDTNASQSSS